MKSRWHQTSVSPSKYRGHSVARTATQMPTITIFFSVVGVTVQDHVPSALRASAGTVSPGGVGFSAGKGGPVDVPIEGVVMVPPSASVDVISMVQVRPQVFFFACIATGMAGRFAVQSFHKR